MKITKMDTKIAIKTVTKKATKKAKAIKKQKTMTNPHTDLNHN